LHLSGYDPWFLTWDGDSYASRSRFIAGSSRVPDPVEGGAFAREVARVAAEVGAAVVLPGTESSLRALSGCLDAFDPATAVGSPSFEIVESALDKSSLDRLARDADLVLPGTTKGSARELGDSADRFRFPAVLKQARSYTPGQPRIRARVFYQADAMQRFLAGQAPGSPWLVQEVIDGDLIAVAGVAWNGRLVSSLHQVADRVYPPLIGGGAYQRTIPEVKPLTAAVARLVSATNWSGIYHAQFIRADRDYLIDFNPRVYGSLALAVAAGHNLMEYWLDHLLGGVPNVSQYRVGVRYRAEVLDMFGIAAGLKRGPRADAVRALLPHLRTAHAVFSTHDPQPALLIGRKLWGRVGRRLGLGDARRRRGAWLLLAIIITVGAVTRAAAAQTTELRIRLTARQNELARTTGLRKRDFPPVFAGGFMSARPSAIRCGSLTPTSADVTVSGFAKASFAGPAGEFVSSSVSVLSSKGMVGADFTHTVRNSFAACLGRMFAANRNATLVSARRFAYTDSLDHAASYRIILHRGRSDEAISFYLFGEGRIESTLTVRSSGRTVPSSLERLGTSLLEARMED
jgi:predicted ATP-grasp superfamily ATP-dependent carboligase